MSVGVPGFEPGTPWSQTRCANRAALHPEIQVLMLEPLYSFLKRSANVTNGLKKQIHFFSAPRNVEEPGFEPGEPLTQFDSLANCWFQPLTHPSLAFPFIENSMLLSKTEGKRKKNT